MRVVRKSLHERNSVSMFWMRQNSSRSHFMLTKLSLVNRRSCKLNYTFLNVVHSGNSRHYSVLFTQYVIDGYASTVTVGGVL